MPKYCASALKFLGYISTTDGWKLHAGQVSGKFLLWDVARQVAPLLIALTEGTLRLPLVSILFAGEKVSAVEAFKWWVIKKRLLENYTNFVTRDGKKSRHC